MAGHARGTPAPGGGRGQTHIVHGGVIGLPRLVALLSSGPASVLRLKKGALREGDDADITVLDLDRKVVINPASFAGKSVNTPFGGWTLRGAPVMTIVGGRIVHDAR